jgi:hypothetical protein
MSDERSPEHLIRILHVDDEETPLKETRLAIDQWTSGVNVDYVPIEGSRADLLSYTASHPEFLPDLLIVDMKMFHVAESPTMVTEYFRDVKEGKKLVNSLRDQIGGRQMGRIRVLFLTQLSRWSDEVKGVQGMGYEVLFKDHFKASMERLEEIVNHIDRKADPMTE